jgi:hypothetical protein
MTNSGKPIQEQFGQVIIDAVAEFAAIDLPTAASLEAGVFSHVGDAQMRRRLCEVFYGARWIYKLGLALLVKDEQQAAHVRAQITDYGAVCEGVLIDMIDFAMQKRLMQGSRYKFEDAVRKTKKIMWQFGNHRGVLGYRPLKWLIVVAEEERIISPACVKELEWLRGRRNSVHIRWQYKGSYIDTSRRAFEAVHLLLSDSKRWRAAHV